MKCYSTKEVRKEYREEAKANEKTKEEEESPVPLVTHLNIILHSNFSNAKVYIKYQQIYNSNGLYAHKSYIAINLKRPSLNAREVCTARKTTRDNLMIRLWKHFFRNLFSQGERKCFVDPMALRCMVNWGFTSCPPLNCYIQIRKLGYV